MFRWCHRWCSGSMQIGFVFIYFIGTCMQHDAQKWLSIRYGYVLLSCIQIWSLITRTNHIYTQTDLKTPSWQHNLSHTMYHVAGCKKTLIDIISGLACRPFLLLGLLKILSTNVPTIPLVYINLQVPISQNDSNPIVLNLDSLSMALAFIQSLSGKHYYNNKMFIHCESNRVIGIRLGQVHQEPRIPAVHFSILLLVSDAVVWLCKVRQ